MSAARVASDGRADRLGVSKGIVQAPSEGSMKFRRKYDRKEEKIRLLDVSVDGNGDRKCARRCRREIERRVRLQGDSVLSRLPAVAERKHFGRVCNTGWKCSNSHRSSGRPTTVTNVRQSTKSIRPSATKSSPAPLRSDKNDRPGEPLGRSKFATQKTKKRQNSGENTAAD